jgi:predicted nuclease of predicted toxin-antitoxin system
MLRLVADQNFNENIITGLLNRRSELDVIRVRDVGLQAAKDPALLAWAAHAGRILLTHDHKTVPDFAYDRVRVGQLMPGVFLVENSGAFRDVIEDLLMADEIRGPDDWRDRVQRFPLRLQQVLTRRGQKTLRPFYHPKSVLTFFSGRFPVHYLASVKTCGTAPTTAGREFLPSGLYLHRSRTANSHRLSMLSDLNVLTPLSAFNPS